MKSCRFYLLIAIILSSFAAFAEAEFEYQLLKDRRKLISLPDYDLATKKIIIDQARLVMRDLFVHRQLKLDTFGKKIDPLPKLDRLEAGLESTNNEEFHQTLLNIFNSQRDLHTRYYLPFPYACYRNLMPFSVNSIGTGGKTKIVVSSLVKDPDYLALLPKDLNIEIGDELISYAGKTIRKSLKELALQTAGANEDGVRRLFLDELSFRIQTVSLMPEDDNVKVVFKKKNGETYKATVPWINRARLSCLKKYEPVKQPSGAARFHNQLEFNQLYSSESSAIPTTNPDISWKIIQNEIGTFGVLYIKSFELTSNDTSDNVRIIQDLLLNKLADTDGLIIDVRNNAGGIIQYGEELVQLFGPRKDLTPLNFSYKMNSTNKMMIYQTYEFLDLRSNYERSLAEGKAFSIPSRISLKSDMNQLEQAYFKPVAIFNNANCYSTCDMFSAHMKDYGYAILVGEDSTTGGGGANVEYLTSFIEYLGPSFGDPFKKLPDNMDMAFSWRKAFRRDGSLIENIGVKSDVIIPTTLKDIEHESIDQYLLISKLLKLKVE